MRRIPRIDLRATLGLLSLLLISAGSASARGEVAAASPYRLNAVADALVATAAPYRSDPRYRLAEGAPDSAAAAAVLAQKPYAREIDDAARASGVDPALVHALVMVESAYRPRAISAKGAIGLMQILPETALRYGVADPSAVSDNLRAGTRHLRRLMERYDDRLDLVLAAYNAGEGAVSRYHESVPPYAETRHYVPAVIANYRAASKPAAAPDKSREYLPGTRLDTQALTRLR